MRSMTSFDADILIRHFDGAFDAARVGRVARVEAERFYLRTAVRRLIDRDRCAVRLRQKSDGEYRFGTSADSIFRWRRIIGVVTILVAINRRSSRGRKGAEARRVFDIPVQCALDARVGSI